MPRLLIIGGSDAGISAGLRARELDRSLEVGVVVGDSYPNFSICGLPYFLGGEVPDPDQLAHRSRRELEDAGVELLLAHTAVAVQPGGRQVSVVNPGGATVELAYDSLVIATGARPRVPSALDVDHPRIFRLHFMADAFAIDDALDGRSGDRAVIVGAGYIGLEVAEALIHRGLDVTILQRPGQVLPTLDPALAEILERELERYGVRVVTDAELMGLVRDDDALRVVAPGGPYTADIVLVATGVEPNSDLARTAGIETGVADAIAVDTQMRTSIPSIYAAGDCAETHHQLLGTTYLPLGTTAHKQGRVAGANVAGRLSRFAGTLGTQVVKVFELAAARTGISHVEAEAHGFDPLTVDLEVPDHKSYYPGSHLIRMHLTGDRRTGRLLGAQMVGHVNTAVAKRIDTVAAAIHNELGVEALSDLDLSYAPPFGSPWDVVQAAGQTWERGARDASASRR